MFSTKLKELRSLKGITQEELANILGVRQQTIGKWELSITVPRLPMLQKIGAFFNVSVDYLLGRTDEPQDTGFQKDLLGDINGDSPLAQKAREATTNGWLPMSKAENPEAEKALEWLEKYNKLDINDKNTINSMIDIALRSKENKQSNE